MGYNYMKDKNTAHIIRLVIRGRGFSCDGRCTTVVVLLTGYG